MRKARLLLGMLALFAVACGADPGADQANNGENDEGLDGKGDGSDDDTTDPSDGEGGDAGAPGNEAFPDCVEDAVPSLPRYTGELLWTPEDFQACADACPGGEDECVATSCAPGGDLFNTCAGAEINACLSEPTSPCRSQWAQQLCCAGERCDLSAADAQDCILNSCGEERDAYQTCGNTDANIDPCVQEALRNCLVAGDAPVDPETPPSPNAGTQTLGLKFAARVSLPFVRAFVRANEKR